MNSPHICAPGRNDPFEERKQRQKSDFCSWREMCQFHYHIKSDNPAVGKDGAVIDVFSHDESKTDLPSYGDVSGESCA